MKVLVAYASRHGATAGIAERIAARLGDAGLSTELLPVEEVGGVGQYDAVVLGAAAYMNHWMKEAASFAKHHSKELGERQVWLFSSGPLGDEQVDATGHDVADASRPKEFHQLEADLRPRGTKVFFGARDPEAEPVGLAEKVIAHLPKAKHALPSGDFRDWDAVDSWADGIAADLQTAPS